jgi:general secretion pathway protein L
MTARRVQFLGDAPHWLLIHDDVMKSRGAGFERGAGETLILIPPVHAVTVQRVDLPDLAPAQAQAAARLIISEDALVPMDQLHIACSGNLIAVADRAAVAAWVDDHDPDVILPAPLLLPEPTEGFTRALTGDEAILRGRGQGFAEDAVVTPIITGSAVITTLDCHAFDAAIITATASPELSLRQGVFARKRDWSIDRAVIRKLAMMAAGLALISLLVPLVEIIRLNHASNLLEARSLSLAQSAIGDSASGAAARTALDARLAASRGGGAGFMATASAVSRAVEAVANVEITALTFEADGTMAVSLRATSPAEIDAVAARMRAMGLVVSPGPINSSEGQPHVEMQVHGT